MAYGRKLTLAEKDKKYTWHPFTQMAEWTKDDPAPPIVIRSGKGVYLHDHNGKKYIDGVSSLWVTLHGHGKKELDRALVRQLKKVAHTTFLGLTHEPAIRLAEELVSVAPGKLSRVFYSDNGSTSVEIALKIAYQYWQQKKPGSGKKTFLSLKNAYHGDTIGSVSVGGMDLFHAKFRPLLFRPHFAPSPYCYRCPHKGKGGGSAVNAPALLRSHCRKTGCKGECLKEAERILKKHNAEIAAAIIEPMVQGAAGMLTMPPGYLKSFEGLCRRYNVLLICDEVATGFGRTGKMFAVEHEGVSPDLFCLSKGITGGYLPLAVTMTTEEIYGAFLGRHEEFKTFFHGHTYTANPLGCATALANLEIFRTEKVLEGLREKVLHLSKELSILGGLPQVGEIRQAGMMVGIELVADKKTGRTFPAKSKTGARVCAACRPHGLIIRPLSDVLVLMPPLSITRKEITKTVTIIRKAIVEACT